MRMHHIEIISLSLDSLHDASFLLVNYMYPDKWNKGQKDECLENLKSLLDFINADFLMAKIEGKPVGFIALNWGFSTTKGQPFLRIQDLFVLPSFRQKGIAKSLIKESIYLAKQNNANRLQLNTGTQNESARRLYSSLGFEWFSKKEIYMLFLKRST